MLYVQTIVQIADNSGGFIGLCIRILGQRKRAIPGDLVMISIKAILLNRKLSRQRKRKVLKGSVRQAVVIRVAYQKLRKFNVFIKGTTNAVAILGNWGNPLANRIKGPIHLELKISKFPRFATISEGVI